MMNPMSRITQNPTAEPRIPSSLNWSTTDEDEINRRRLRAREETFRITNRDPRHPVFSNFRVQSGSGLTYQVEIRDLRERQFACDCVDFRINGLGTCKHIEAVLLLLEGRHRKPFRAAMADGSTRLEVVVDRTADTLRLAGNSRRVPRSVARWFDAAGHVSGPEIEPALECLRDLSQGACPALRISQEVDPWLEERRRITQRRELRHEYELRVQRGEWPAQETKVALFPYQREGMLHLAFTERALLADEMGLGKTIQAIAACSLLQRLGQARRVLVVTPASLKTEWEEQIRRFTDLPYQLVYGGRFRRLRAYETAPFFTIANYEQMVADSLEVNQRLQPEVVVLDEAQRIKNWNTKTAQAVKRLRSRYAFILTGTPIENRIDELHSLMDFLNPALLGPLFRFNRDFYELDERGRPIGYCRLDQLHERIRPVLLRRRKAEVETELPPRTDRNHFVPLNDGQRLSYAAHEQQVMRLVSIAQRRPLTPQEQDKLQRELAMMRMICDSNYILDPEDDTCPKLAELEKLLDECAENESKVIVFSEWERMLELVRRLCKRRGLGHAWHTGSVPQKRRRAEINAFKDDPACRVFLSTDSGATGLNLQIASTVINCDLPWNPARLEQRIARAWRKHQSRPVTVINLISENTLEHRMLETLATKRTVAESVLDHPGRVTSLKIRSGRQAMLQRLSQLLTPVTPAPSPTPPKPPRPADPALAFALAARQCAGETLLRCEERYPSEGPHSVLFVVVNSEAAVWRERLARLHADCFGNETADPLAPTRLIVIDRTTEESLTRLIDAGVVSKTDRAIRPLLPEPTRDSPPALSPEDQARARAHRTLALRKLKMARVLFTGDFLDEARAAGFEAALSLGRALAVERRLPEPASLEAALQAPLRFVWPEQGQPLEPWLRSEPADSPSALDYLEKQLA